MTPTMLQGAYVFGLFSKYSNGLDDILSFLLRLFFGDNAHAFAT
jgi:hypothetical protein